MFMGKSFRYDFFSNNISISLDLCPLYPIFYSVDTKNLIIIRKLMNIFRKLINAKPAGTITANALPTKLITGLYFIWFNPNV